MGQISAYQEAPYQGVSQAPPQVRRRDQAEAMEDVLAALPQGCQKRPPFQYVGALAGHPGAAKGVFHHIERSAGDALLTITKEAGVAVPRVYQLSDLALQPLTVGAAAQTYLNTGILTPQHDLGAMTVVDFTFVWNRNATVVNSTDINPIRPYEALVWIKAAAYGRTYEVLVNGVSQAKVTTPDGTTASDSKWVDTDVIAGALVSGTYTAVDGAAVTGGLGAVAGLTIAVHGPVISIQGAADFEIEVKDGQGGLAVSVAKDKIQKFSDLPQKAPDGFVVRIVEQTGTDQDDFYVQFSKTAGDGTGVWEECLAPGALLGLDKNTMPVALKNDGGWGLDVVAWKQRTTGNEELVKDPDFIGQVVQDVTFWQGRLGIISGEGITLSSTDDPFQLYPRTLASVLDSDPFGRVNPAPGETTFRYAVAFESTLVLAGDTVQAHVTYDGILTPTKAVIDTFTSHELSKLIRPAGVNSKVYFATPRGDAASGIEEVAIDRVTNTAIGEDLTTAAFRYLPAAIDRSAVSPVNYLAVYGVSGSSSLYVHLFRHSEQERVQNAFERWHLPPGYALGGMFFVNTSLYVLACASGVGHVLKADLSPLVLDAGSSIQTYLDMKATEVQAPGVYDAVTGKTTVTLPYPRMAETVLVVRAPGTVDYPNAYIAHVDEDASAAAGADKLVVTGDFSAVPYFVGHTYESRWVPSRIYPLDSNNRPLRNGRCNLRRIAVDLASTGYIRAEVTVGGRAPQVTEFFGFHYDDPGSFFDTAPSATIRWEFPVMGENEQTEIAFVNDSPFGFTILGYEWTAEFNERSQRR